MKKKNLSFSVMSVMSSKRLVNCFTYSRIEPLLVRVLEPFETLSRQILVVLRAEL